MNEIEWQDIPEGQREEVQCLATEGGERCKHRGYYINNGETKGFWCDEHVPGGIPVKVSDLDIAIMLGAQALVSLEGHPPLSAAHVETIMVRLRFGIGNPARDPKGYDFREVQSALLGALSYLANARAAMLGAKQKVSTGFLLMSAGAGLRFVCGAIR